MNWVSTTCLMEVSLFRFCFLFDSWISIFILDFYDPDGYYFNKEGKDEFGGYYDSDNCYHPGDGNKHEFESLDYYEDDYDDELIRQFERGH